MVTRHTNDQSYPSLWCLLFPFSPYFCDLVFWSVCELFLEALVLALEALEALVFWSVCELVLEALVLALKALEALEALSVL